ncbi:hypothetical protein GH714_025971 [Hevea brasiliensis]|uniref:RRM domain-containing protein n=1 Tax=Hevea brasiliensis TaxID=3981 RepID=A0A6A6KST3_HEVBR|nr:hypothetical protein GH714_025971 [Hevea brasiliensis]
MDLPVQMDDYIKETIDDSLGLPISTHTLQLKLRASEDAHCRLRDQYLLLLGKLRQKDQLIDRTKAEANMNAVALKKFVEENQRLAAECASLVIQCNKWERECSLYDNDREALMDFGNEADERAREAEFRVRELEEVLGKLSEELQFYKHEYANHGVASPAKSTDTEQHLLESILATLVSKDEVEFGHAFLEANSGYESCQKLLKMWNRKFYLWLKVKNLQKDKEHLRINLTRAEEEVHLLSEENNILDEENKKLLKHHQEHNLDGSGGKHTSSASAKLSMHNKTRNRGLAFVTMGSPDEALAAIKNLESYMNYAKLKKKKPSPPPPPKPAATFNLFVANLPFEAKAKDLKEFFNAEGTDVVSAEIVYHDNPRRPSGYGFVAFKTKKEADAALSAFPGKMFMGRSIRVSRSRQFVRQQRNEGLQSDDTSTELNSGVEQVDPTHEN